MKGGAIRIILADRVLTVGGTLFYRAEDKDGLGSRWTDLCKYVLSELGNIDIKDYQVVTDLKRE